MINNWFSSINVNIFLARACPEQHEEISLECKDARKEFLCFY